MAEKPEEIKITSGVAVAQMFQGVQTIQDLLRMEYQAAQIDALKANLDLSLGLGMGVATEQALAGPEGNPDLLRSRIVEMYGNLYDFWKAGIWGGVGATWADSLDRLVQSANWIFAYKTLQHEIAVGQRMRRHWNKIYYPMVPDVRVAFHLFYKGRITSDQFYEYASWDGWDKTNADLLVDWMDRVPDNWTAFSMWCRGLLEDEERNAVYKANLYPEEWHDKITENFMYVPGPYELMRMADFVEVDQIWALDALKKRGISERDRAKFWEAIQIRPLREEIRGLVTEWIWRYRYGRCTHDELDTALTALPIREKERTLDIKKAELVYEDELVDEWIEILRWDFRYGRITDEEFLEHLTDPKGPCRIREEKANLIVELEKAKGYMGYY